MIANVTECNTIGLGAFKIVALNKIVLIRIIIEILKSKDPPIQRRGVGGEVKMMRQF